MRSAFHNPLQTILDQQKEQVAIIFEDAKAAKVFRNAPVKIPNKLPEKHIDRRGQSDGPLADTIVEQLKACKESGSIYLVHGAPGTGKSTLALDVAKRVEQAADTGGAPMQILVKSGFCMCIVNGLLIPECAAEGIFHGACYLRFGRGEASATSADILAQQRALLTSLGEDASNITSADNPSSAMTHIKEALEGSAYLIVLDNVWNLEVVEAFDVAGHSGVLLVTARRVSVQATHAIKGQCTKDSAGMIVILRLQGPHKAAGPAQAGVRQRSASEGTAH